MNATLAAPVAQAHMGGKYLTFALSGELYGISVLKIREIIRLPAITAVPQVPAHIKGVLNLRGKIVPVLDLRLKFGLTETVESGRTCVVVVEVGGASRKVLSLGLVVDDVKEVANLAAGDIADTPDFGTAVDTACIDGMAKVKGSVITLLDINRVVGAEELETGHLANP